MPRSGWLPDFMALIGIYFVILWRHINELGACTYLDAKRKEQRSLSGCKLQWSQVNMKHRGLFQLSARTLGTHRHGSHVHFLRSWRNRGSSAKPCEVLWENKQGLDKSCVSCRGPRQAVETRGSVQLSHDVFRNQQFERHLPGLTETLQRKHGELWIVTHCKCLCVSYTGPRLCCKPRSRVTFTWILRSCLPTKQDWNST